MRAVRRRDGGTGAEFREGGQAALRGVRWRCAAVMPARETAVEAGRPGLWCKRGGGVCMRAARERSPRSGGGSVWRWGGRSSRALPTSLELESVEGRPVGPVPEMG